MPVASTTPVPVASCSSDDRCCDGGSTADPSTTDSARLTEVSPQTPKASREPIFRCSECGNADIEWTAYVTANGNEVTRRESPTDDVWCPACEDHTGYITDYGFGFELWREAEWSGHFATFAEALAEAQQSDRPYEIDGAASAAEVSE